MPKLLLSPLLIAAVVAMLPGCGGTTSNRSAEGAYAQLTSDVATMAGKGAQYALILEDCTNTARTDAAAAGCARQLLDRLAGDFTPIRADINAVEQVASEECRAELEKAVGDAALLDGQDPDVPTTAEQADALTTQVTNDLQQFAQEIALAKSACV